MKWDCASCAQVLGTIIADNIIINENSKQSTVCLYRIDSRAVQLRFRKYPQADGHTVTESRQIISISLSRFMIPVFQISRRSRLQRGSDLRHVPGHSASALSQSGFRRSCNSVHSIHAKWLAVLLALHKTSSSECIEQQITACLIQGTQEGKTNSGKIGLGMTDSRTLEKADARSPGGKP